MKGADEIRDIIVNQLGIKDLTVYQAWLKAERERYPTAEDVDRLSPDLIDNGAFWRVAEELFSTDPVSNCVVGRDKPEPLSQAEANRVNMTIYHMDGITGLFEAMMIHYGANSPKILEIGPGYGAFRDWLAARWPVARYHAADSYPRIPEAVETTPGGLLSTFPMVDRYHAVVASNVFQHLSLTQRRIYYSDISRCLHEGGWFTVSQFYDNGAPRKDRDPEGRIWCRHYGQYTQIQSRKDIVDDLQVHFTIEGEIVRPPQGWAIYHCRKKAVA